MRRPVILAFVTMALIAGSAARAAAPDAGESHDFELHDAAGAAKGAHGAKASKIKATKTEAAMKFVVVDKEKGPVKGVVVALTAPDDTKYYTDETDADGYAEVLVPVGRKYELTYLSLGRKDVAATVSVTNEPNQNVKLTLRYLSERLPPPPFVMAGVNFDTGKATLRPESFPKLDMVVDFMKHKKHARVQISGHTDNVGKPKANKTLSQDRAQACRMYIVSKGVDASRLDAVGYGDERPIAPNTTDEGRQKNRRIEAKEL